MRVGGGGEVGGKNVKTTLDRKNTYAPHVTIHLPGIDAGQVEISRELSTAHKRWKGGIKNGKRNGNNAGGHAIKPQGGMVMGYVFVKVTK